MATNSSRANLAPVLGTAFRLSAAVLAFSLLAGTACKKSEPAQTTIPATWRNPEFLGAPFTHVFVMGVGRNDDYRRLYEDSMVRAIEGQGATARASWTLFPEPDKLQKERVLIAVTEAGFDAVVITRLRSVDEEQEYVPGKPLTSSDLYMSGYDEAYAVNSDPGYYKTNTTYRVETTLYSVRDQMVAWVVLSDTVNPHSVQEIIELVSTTTAQRMRQEGLIGSGDGYAPQND